MYEAFVASIDGIVWEGDVESRQLTFVSPEAERVLGYPLALWMTSGFWAEHLHPDDREWAVESRGRAVKAQGCTELEYRMIGANGRTVWIRDLVSVVDDTLPPRLCGVMIDVTERKQSEDERRTHLRFLQSMDRVNRAIQGTNDRDRMLHDVLEVVLDIFACDRSWLICPCDPDAVAWRPMMERARPGTPGGGLHAPDVLLDEGVARLMRAALDADGPIACGPAAAHPVADVLAAFGVKSALTMALRPRVGQPLMLELHQCVHPRAWTAQETRLFHELGRRLADAVTGLTAFRDLQEGSERLQLAVKASAVGLWDWDVTTGTVLFSPEYKRQLGYEEHELTNDVEEWRRRVHPDDIGPILEGLGAFFEGNQIARESEFRMRHKDGSWRWIFSRGEVRRAADGTPLRMLGCHLDITDRKRADQERQAHVWFLESMDRVNRAIQGAIDLDQLMEDVIEATLSIFDSDRAFLAHPCDPAADTWSVLVERARPAYAIDLEDQRDLPMTSEIAERCRILRSADGPVQFGPGAARPISARAAESGVRSMMVMAVYPHADHPYVFGLHQCSHARTWTPDEERLLQEIGRRLADGLTSRFVLRSLRESESRLAEAQRVAQVGHWERDVAGGQVTVSPELLRIFGLGPDYPRDLAGWEAQWRALVHPDDQEPAAAALEAALHGGPRYDVEYRVVRPDGQERVVHSQGDAVEGDLGRARRMFGTVQDITEFRRAQDELRASESRFRVFVDHATDAFFLHNRRGVILDVNQQACDSLGYTRDELVGMSPKDIDLDTDFQTRIGSRLESEQVLAFDSRHRRKDGSTFPVEVRLRRFRMDGGRFAVALVRDITQRKEAERALVESYSLLNAVVEGTPAAVFVKDVAGRYLMINSIGARAFGLTIDEITGKHDYELFPPGIADEIIEHDRRVLQSGEPQTLEETATMRGVSRVFLTSRGVYRDAQGRIIGLVGFSRDITELKRLEQQFRQAQKMEAVGQLAGGIAHDFNNLLTAIIGFGEMAFNGLAPGDPNRELLSEIRRAGDRAANLTRQLLAFSRKQVLRPEVVSLNALLSEVIKLLQRLISEDIELVLSADDTLGLTRIDTGQFEQAVINLAVNARDAMPQGGRLAIATRNVEIDEAYASARQEVEPGSYVMVSVSDTGHGMDEETRARIFEPFFTTKPVGEGTGLGLAMVYGFVKQSGGHVEASSEPGIGTTFRIFLPRVFDAEATPVAAEELAPIPKGHETVLLVEDEEVVRNLSRRVLQSAGYTVLVARHGPEAILLASQHEGPIHLLATDLVMPRMSGLEVASQLSQLLPDMRILLMSGYPNEAVIRHGVPPGASLLQKPFNAVALARAVRQVLDASTT
ncbi:MAG TPA: PAS domain S-box protein [Vicinamibacterales bacterium]|jgi:PAS domain S-box-containing protein|nr:PAS domain S-box protein [Vicinamibacterales bacterium]